jgi:hypothetical protein
MVRGLKIPMVALLATVLLLAAAEVGEGTSLAFVSMMAIALVCIGVTYNELGGLGTFSGIMFITFALRNIVISQFAKVVLCEAADKNLEAPQLTITIYALFYFFAMLGVFLFGKFRFQLPRPAEPTTQTRLGMLYAVALPLGALGVVLTAIAGSAYESDADVQYGPQHAIGVALTPLLLFALVLAVDMRLKKTRGKHSFGLLALIPAAGASFIGFSNSQRTAVLLPGVVYFLACQLRGYRFRIRHYAAALFGVAFFFLLLSPLMVYSRVFIRDQPFVDRVETTWNLLHTFHDPRDLEEAVEERIEQSASEREQYYSRPGTYTLSRFALIRADSDVIAACAHGFHYGLKPTKIELLKAVPSFLYKKKPRYESGQDYIGRVSGLSGDARDVTYPQISAVGDSYGAFGWFGVILFPFFAFPLFFSVYESLFDFTRPWGTVAFGIGFITFGELMLERYIPLLIRDPLIIVGFSYFFSWIIGLVPTRADREFHGRAEQLAGASAD